MIVLPLRLHEVKSEHVTSTSGKERIDVVFGHLVADHLAKHRGEQADVIFVPVKAQLVAVVSFGNTHELPVVTESVSEDELVVSASLATLVGVGQGLCPLFPDLRLGELLLR